MSLLVSLSDLFSGNDILKNDGIIYGEHMPVYQAVLISMIFPVVATAMTYIVKYANNTVRLESTDMTMAMQFFFAWVFFILGVW